MTGDICSDARVLTDKGHPVCAEMKKKRKVVYVGVTKEGNVDAEVRAVIKRPNFLIKNKNDRPISIFLRLRLRGLETSGVWSGSVIFASSG